MQKFGWRQRNSVREWLFAEGYRFEFFQALRLLEQIASTEVIQNNLSRGRALSSAPPTLQGTVDPFSLIRLRSQISFAFPASEVSAVRLASAKPFAAELITPLMCLGGAKGPLPDAFSELVLERLKQRDSALSDFLDLFHHRFLLLLYQSQKRTRLWLGAVNPPSSKFAGYLFSFAGVGRPEIRKQVALPEQAYMAYAGLFWQQPRSAVGLQQILSSYLGVSVKIVQLRGGWRFIEREDQTAIGRTAQNQELGINTVIGKRFWSMQSGFDIEIGPLSLDKFEAFLPGERRFADLCSLVRFYAGEGLSFCLKLKLKSHEIPGLHLGKNHLGWTSWLHSKGSDRDEMIQIQPG